MKGLVIGLGSMGKRRIRLLTAFFPDIKLCGVDTRADRRDEVAARYAIPCYESIDDALAGSAPQIGFICTSPLSHAAITTQLLQAELHVFSEINLVADGYDQNIVLAKENSLVLFLSSTPIYRREIQFIEDEAKKTGCPLTYQYHVGQYLPDWHPWEKFTDFFVGDRRTNGCRELFGIELPWMTRAFGAVTKAETIARNLSSLDIDFPDSYLVTLTHETGIVGQLAVDVVARKAIRQLTVVGENLFLQWGGRPDNLMIHDFEHKADITIDTYDDIDRDSRYADNIIENAYVDELAAFFDTLAGQDVRRHTFEEDARILNIIDGIEEVTS